MDGSDGGCVETRVEEGSSVDPLGETRTQHDTVGAVDTDTPDFDEHAARVWRDGSVVADRFRIIRQIGQGGMGHVYLAQDEALKRIPQEILFDLDARDDLRQEANRLLDLAHDNIVRVHTYYDGPTWPFFAMEFLEGPTLKQLLRDRRAEERTFSVEEILEIARQVGDGLAYAHSHNVVHRDLKPANVMLARLPEGDLDGDDLIKITDFGISRVVADGTLRQTGRRSGTLPYMSPEQFRGEPATPRGDVYSFACTLYEMASGSPPFYTGDIGYQILNILPRPLDNLPKRVGDVILTGLAKDPDHRFESVEDLVGALEGRVPVPVHRSYRRVAATIGKMASAVMVAVAIWLVAYVSGRTDNTSTAQPSRESVGPPTMVTRTSIEEKHDRARFGEWLRGALDEQLPPTVGRDFGALSAVAPRLTFELEFREADAPRGASYLSRLVFVRERADGDGVMTQRKTRGASNGGVWTFTFLDVAAGEYVLSAHVERDLDLHVLPEFAVFSGRGLVVDLTPPVFDIAAVRPGLLVDDELMGEPRFVTFDNSFEFRIVGLSADEGIAGAFVQAVSRLGKADKQRVHDLTRFSVSLPQPGVPKTLLISTFDHSGNDSQDREFVVLRRFLQLDRFVATGNRAAVVDVEGHYRVEGDVLPKLVFWVNGARVDVEATLGGPDGEPVPGTVGGDDDTPLRTVAFAAKVPVDRATNTIEVRFLLGDEAKGFGSGGTIPSVSLHAPDIELEVVGYEAPEIGPGPRDESDGPDADAGGAVLAADGMSRTVYTNESRVTIRGTVDDYFPELGVVLVLQSSERAGTRTVVLEPAGSVAMFSEELELPPGLTTTVSVECYFNSPTESLAGAPEPLAIVSDVEPPSGRIAFSKDGDQVVASIHAEERLSALRGRVGLGAWTPLAAEGREEAGSVIYTWRFADPRARTSVAVELTDIAGNTKEVPGLYMPASVAADTAAASPTLRPRIFRSPFLRRHGMSFVTCGVTGLEMGTTEVPEAVWFEFLEDTGLRDEDAGPATRGHPMVLNDAPVKWVRRFVKWFEAQAEDGYAYHVPTVDEWTMAFAGVDSRDDAYEEISRWFQEEFEFSSGQAPRYGLNVASPIGSRPRNATPTRLLDMESNVQELVYDRQGLEAVIGGNNQHDNRAKIERACRTPRALDRDHQELLGRLTGLRLCRRPTTTRGS